MIQTLPHHKEQWVNTQLIQILHDNWPEVIIRAKHSGLRPGSAPAVKRSSLRGYNANFPITVADGTVYLPPAGGTMASGDSLDDRFNCDNIFRELNNWQSSFSKNAPAIRTALNWPASKKLHGRMAFDNHDCCFYEPTRPIRLKFLDTEDPIR